MNAQEIKQAAEALAQYMDPNWSEQDARTVLCLLISQRIFDIEDYE